jgi:hypothetical protein
LYISIEPNTEQLIEGNTYIFSCNQDANPKPFMQKYVLIFSFNY